MMNFWLFTGPFLRGIDMVLEELGGKSLCEVAGELALHLVRAGNKERRQNPFLNV